MSERSQFISLPILASLRAAQVKAVQTSGRDEGDIPDRKTCPPTDEDAKRVAEAAFHAIRAIHTPPPFLPS